MIRYVLQHRPLKAETDVYNMRANRISIYLFSFQESQTFVCVNNELVCNVCRGTEPPKVCAGCRREFLPEEKKIGVKENNEYYHDLCFLCSKCNHPIGTQKFVRTGPGNQTCNSCYESRLLV